MQTNSDGQLLREYAERAAAASSSVNSADELARLRADHDELLRLRGEVGVLRGQTNELDKLRAANRQRQQSLAHARETAGTPATDQEKDPDRQTAIAKINDAHALILGLLLYAADHRDQLPATLDEASNYWSRPEGTGTNQFELLIHGSLANANVTNRSTTIALRERQPSFLNGGWVKAYSFVDGHSEIKREPPEGFDAWEQAHMPPPPDHP